MLTRKRLTTALIRPRGLAGWSGHLLFAYNEFRFSCIEAILTLKASIMTEADDKFCDIFPNFREKKSGMIFHENRPPADDSHEIPCLICYF